VRRCEKDEEEVGFIIGMLGEASEDEDEDEEKTRTSRAAMLCQELTRNVAALAL
jgi:hypothetical protein